MANEIFIQRLLEISSGDSHEKFSSVKYPQTPVWQEIYETLLSKRNGFIAFEQALEVFGSGACEHPCDIIYYNAMLNWPDIYGLEEDAVMFGQDAFGFPFFLSSKRVGQLNSETGEVIEMGNSLNSWASSLLEDWDYMTGWSVLKKWQDQFGQLGIGERLYPKIMFMFGGKYEVSNLYVAQMSEGVDFRADLFLQTKSIPDGTAVNIKVRRDT